MSCRYHAESKTYRCHDDTECTHDDYGDPVKHCTATRRCNAHVGVDELTCPRCIGHVRTALTRIVDLLALMPAAALEAGRIDSEAMSLAAGSADPVVTSWRRIDRARETGGLVGDGTDETDPAEVLGTWQKMLSEDYGGDLGERVTAYTAAKYLGEVLTKVAQDSKQDFPLLLREVTGIRKRLERVLSVAPVQRKGAPCPWCDAPKRLTWVEGVTVEQDWWHCPDDREHWMSHADYEEWQESRRSAGPKPSARVS